MSHLRDPSEYNAMLYRRDSIPDSILDKREASFKVSEHGTWNRPPTSHASHFDEQQSQADSQLASSTVPNSSGIMGNLRRLLSYMKGRSRSNGGSRSKCSSQSCNNSTLITFLEAYLYRNGLTRQIPYAQDELAVLETSLSSRPACKRDYHLLNEEVHSAIEKALKSPKYKRFSRTIAGIYSSESDFAKSFEARTRFDARKETSMSRSKQNSLVIFIRNQLPQNSAIELTTIYDAIDHSKSKCSQAAGSDHDLGSTLPAVRAQLFNDASENTANTQKLTYRGFTIRPKFQEADWKRCTHTDAIFDQEELKRQCATLSTGDKSLYVVFSTLMEEQQKQIEMLITNLQRRQQNFDYKWNLAWLDAGHTLRPGSTKGASNSLHVILKCVLQSTLYYSRATASPSSSVEVMLSSIQESEEPLNEVDSLNTNNQVDPVDSEEEKDSDMDKSEFNTIYSEEMTSDVNLEMLKSWRFTKEESVVSEKPELPTETNRKQDLQEQLNTGTQPNPLFLSSKILLPQQIPLPPPIPHRRYPIGASTPPEAENLNTSTPKNPTAYAPFPNFPLPAPSEKRIPLPKLENSTPNTLWGAPKVDEKAADHKANAVAQLPLQQRIPPAKKPPPPPLPLFPLAQSYVPLPPHAAIEASDGNGIGRTGVTVDWDTWNPGRVGMKKGGKNKAKGKDRA